MSEPHVIAHPQESNSGTNALLLVLMALLIAAPLFRGGLSPLALLVLEILGLILVVLVLWRPPPRSVGFFEAALLALLFAIPLLYLLSLPPGLADWLPGREPYTAALTQVAGEGGHGWGAASLIPLRTESVWLALLIPLGVYLAIRALDEDAVLALTSVLFAVAAAEALLALFQFGAAQGGINYPFVDLFDRTGSSGSFVNRNHLAGMLEMTLPLALALFLYDFGRRHKRQSKLRGWRHQVLVVGYSAARPSVAYAILSVLFIVGIVVTKSRTGIALTMLAVLLCAVLFARRIGGRNSFGLTGQLIAMAVAFAIALGLLPVLDRFSVEGISGDARWPLATSSFDSAGLLLPLGSGPGTYTDVFTLFQPIELGQYFIAHAHNDYLEALFELGLLGVVLFIAFFAFFVRQWGRLVNRDEWSRFRFLQIGAGIGIIMMLLHSLFDYNLRTPANLAYFAFIAGIFFSDPGRAPFVIKKREHRPRTLSTKAAGIDTAPSTSGGPNKAPISGTQIPNPFFD